MKILIALDESPVSARAARVASRLFPGAEFLVINVAGIPVPWVGTAGFGEVTPLTWVPPPENGDGDQEGRQNLMDRAKAVGVPDPDVIASTGDPVTEICSAAEEHDVDVIVVGSHHKTALRRLIDPSVAAGVVRDTYRPVLVVSGSPPIEE